MKSKTMRRVVMNPRCDKNCLHEIDTQWSLSSYLFMFIWLCHPGKRLQIDGGLGDEVLA
jgi:hypothetical protein